MPSINLKVFWMPDMSEKKSPSQKEKPTLVKTPQSDGKGMKRKLIMPSSPQEEDDKKGTPKRKRGSLQLDSSPTAGSVVSPRTPGGASRLIVPLSERQQMALLMRMTDESSQGDSSPKPTSPLTPVQPGKRATGDKRVHKRNERGETSLHIAAIRGDVKQTKKLIKAGADVNVKDFAGWTPLHEACNHGWLPIAKQLLKAGANVNVHGLENDTPLHDASGNGHHKLVELLLKHGANPLQANSRGKTPVDVAASADIVKLLRKEIISSSSDSSSVDDARSPTSPESTSSAKEEDRQGDLEGSFIHLLQPASHITTLAETDLSPRAQGQIASKWERSCAGVSTSGIRRSLLPKSPEKTASPRLFLKFQHIKSKDIPSSESSEKSKDTTEPQYKAYSVTVETGDHKDSISFVESNSSNDSDLYDPKLSDTAKVKHVITKDLCHSECRGETVVKSTETQHNQPVDNSEGYVSEDRLNHEVSLDYGGLVSHSTQPFTPQFEDISDAEEESTDIVKQPNIRTDSNNIPQIKESDSSRSRLKNTSSDFTQQGLSLSSHSNTISSGTNSIQVEIHTPETGVNSSTQRRNSGNSSSSDPGIAQLAGKWDLRSSPQTDDHMGQASKSDNSRTSSPTRYEKDRFMSKLDKEGRSSSLKVPPLKIIIPPKQSSTVDSDNLKLLLTKPPLPYVLNPTRENNLEEQPAEVHTVSQTSSRASSPASSRPSSAASDHGASTAAPAVSLPPPPPPPLLPPVTTALAVVAVTTDDEKQEKSLVDKTQETQVKEREELASTKVKEEESKEEKPETTQRITRCLRSHTAQMQQQKQQTEKQGSSDLLPRVNEPTTSASSRGQKTEETEDLDIHPRKRKLRPKQETSQPAEVVPSQPITLEKPPNPFETFLSIRKQVETRRRSLTVIHPKAPHRFKDYLMISCSYVLQGNAASTLSVPMLSPPNSVTEPMRDLFIDQEKARYKLRLQHLIEREKLMLSIEQEMVREHGRAARALTNQSVPLSVCTILKDEEIYNLIEQEQADEREKNVRSRYNGRQFISWIQDVGDKYEKIKELLLLRHHHEAESLYAVQKMDWEWKMKELGHCDYNSMPVIDDLHVPMVQVNDDFDLLPT